MTRWTLYLGKGYWCYCDADGSGKLLGPGYEAEINDHQHAILFVKAHREGAEAVVPDEVIDFAAFEAEEGEA